MSSCGDMESADVPVAINMLVREIKNSIDVDQFKVMDADEALAWLEKNPCSAGLKYKEFLHRHGHRCLKEFDVYSKPWRENKLPLIKVLQKSCDLKEDENKKVLTISEVIDKLQIPLSWKAKRLLGVLIPLSRRAVLNREKAKSTIIKHLDVSRKGFWELAERLVREGRLPEKELLFFLSNHEVMQLIQERSSYLVQSAIRRRQVYPELNKLRFPEITKGVPRPVKVAAAVEDDLCDLEIKGVPVSQGAVKGLARVAHSLEDAADIKPGEILITYSTDIAWSPYFPLLAGIATELGGLISHGAVVAREYGLPCVVGVFEATAKFKTGDFVLVDGNLGLLKRLESRDRGTRL